MEKMTNDDDEAVFLRADLASMTTKRNAAEDREQDAVAEVERLRDALSAMTAERDAALARVRELLDSRNEADKLLGFTALDLSSTTAERDAARSAIDAALAAAGGRWDEWGERAVSVGEILTAAQALRHDGGWKFVRTDGTTVDIEVRAHDQRPPHEADAEGEVSRG